MRQCECCPYYFDDKYGEGICDKCLNYLINIPDTFIENLNFTRKKKKLNE